MIEDKIILSILIPTYNREKYLRKAIITIFEQITDDIRNKIEIIVSDNCSNDGTQELLKNFDKNAKSDRINFRFFKNNKNLGADRNFFKLIDESTGKFCWIFGDDEFLLDGGLIKIIDLLEKNLEVGLVHISNKKLKKQEKFEKLKVQKFIKKVNYMISFITANIFNKRYIDESINYDEFKGSNLIQELFYFQSILKSEYNIYIYDEIFTTERAENIGNYKLFETFGKNQNSIFNFFVKIGLKKSTVDFINKKMLREFFPVYIENLNKNNKWENEDVYSEMKDSFSKYLEFWIFCMPLIKLPMSIRKIYSMSVRIFNKLVKVIGV